MRERLHLFLTQKGLGPTEADILTPVLLVAAVAIISALGYVIARRIVLRSVAAIVLRTKTEWDDAIVRCKVLDRLAHLLPALMIYLLVPMVVPGREAWIEIIRDAASIYTIVIVGLAIMAALGIPLDPGTLMVGPLALGLVVDDTVHFLVRYRRLRASGQSPDEATSAAIQGTGRALVLTTVLLTASFLTLLAASTAMAMHFGVIAALIAVLALIADLIVLPAALRVARV